MNKIFKDKMTDPKFLKTLSGKLEICFSRFKTYISTWRKQKFKETRGTSNVMLLESKQYDMIYVMICGLKTASMPPMDEIPGVLLPYAKRNNYLFHNIENRSWFNNKLRASSLSLKKLHCVYINCLNVRLMMEP